MPRRVRTGAITSHFVEFSGAAVKSKGFRSAVRIAHRSTQSGKVTPHTLRHTAATWLMQRGADPWKTAGILGTSVEALLDTDGSEWQDLNLRPLRPERCYLSGNTNKTNDF